MNGYLIFIIALLSLLGSYMGIKSLSDHNSRKQKNLNEQRILIVKGCKENSGKFTAEYPAIIDWYCNCMADTMIVHFTYRELIAQDKMSIEQRTVLLKPLMIGFHKRAMDRIESEKVINR